MRNLIHNLNNIKLKCDNRNKKSGHFAELQFSVDSFSGKQRNYGPFSNQAGLSLQTIMKIQLSQKRQF
jgi:hypothetical protein